jgi:arylsulfatase A-like enzyme
MAEFREYPEGAPFPGVIGRTVSESVPAWPVPRRPRAGAPNVLIVLLDDVGFAQFGPFGASIETPTLDRLAANGLRYRDFHTTALCTPTRSCLMTGRNHHANGMAVVTAAATGFPGYNSVLPREHGFLSEHLVEQGYATFALGKWHLTPVNECNPGAARRRWPLGRGFERFYGILGGMTSQYVPDLVEDNHPIDPPRRPEDGYHLTEDLADHAIAYLKDLKAAAPEKPFFLYFCPCAGHTPHHVPREWADRYRGKFDQGWDRLREEIFARQLEQGIVPPGTVLSPRPDWIPAWDSLSDDERRVYARQMEVYAGFMSHTDHHLGRLIDFLEQIGELDNTLLLLTSDNGASAEGGVHGSYNAQFENNNYEPSLQENLAALERWGDPSTFPHYSWGWAWAGNTPLRRWKRYVHEGGVTDAMIAHWPAGISAKGEVRDQYAHVTDILPTVLEALGLEPADRLNAVPQAPIQGVSFAHTFDDAAAPTRKQVQYYEMFGSRAIWQDGWKAVVEQEQGIMLTEELLRQQRWELYHVATDVSECRDLAAERPEKLEELIQRWWAEAGKYNVLPLDARRQGRMLAPKPRLTRGDDQRYVYYPHAAPLLRDAAVNLHNRSHTIRVEVVIPAGGAEGVLLAQGGRFAGYTLFVQGRRLHYVHNYLGLCEYTISSEVELPDGALTLGFELIKTGEHRGVGRLFVGDACVGQGELPRTVPNAFDRVGEGLCCGYDSGTAVTPRYQAPFRFSGTLQRVTVEVDGPRQVNAAAEQRAEMVAQ